MAIYMWREFTPPSDRLYFEANTAGSTVKLRTIGSPTIWSFETSNDGVTRTDYTILDTITLSNIGDKFYMRNKSETAITLNSASDYYRFDMTGEVSVYGDIGYLLCKNSTMTIPGTYTFYNLFNGCTSLKRGPSLPATTLKDYCYRSMFQGCTNLETLPKLPAKSLPTYSYHVMFDDCSKIKLSTTQTGEYQTPYRIPTIGTGTTADTYSLRNMFRSTGGTFTGTPTINTTYYTSNQVI